MRTNVPGWNKNAVGVVENTNLGDLERVRALRRADREKRALEERVERLERLVEHLVSGTK